MEEMNVFNINEDDDDVLEVQILCVLRYTVLAISTIICLAVLSSMMQFQWCI